MKLALFICIILFSNYSRAFTSEKNTITFCYETWEPFAYVNSHGESEGEHIAFLKKAVSSIGYQASFSELPFLRCLSHVKAGDIDFMLHIDESSNISFIDFPIGNWDLVLASKANNQGDAGNNDEKHYNVIISQSFSYPQPVIDKLNKTFRHIIKKSYYIGIKNDIKRLFKLIESGFVDAMLIDKIWAEHELEKGDFNLVLSEQLFYSQPQYIGYGKTRHELAEQLRQALISVSSVQN